MKRPIRYIASLCMAAAFAAGCDVVAPDSFSQSTFLRVYGGGGDDEGWGVRQTADGGFVIVGTTSSLGNGGKDVYLIKTDAAGRQQWARTYGGAGNDEGRDVDQTTDGGYVIVGSTLSFSSGGNDMYVIRTDANGDTLWTRNLGGASDDVGVSVQQTRDGGFVAGGSLKSPPSLGASDFWVVKLHPDGSTQWQKSLGGASDEVCEQVRETDNGAFVLVGGTSTTPNMALLNSDGTERVALHPFVGPTAGAKAVQTMPDGRFLVIGYHRFAGAIDSLYVFTTDSSTRRKETSKAYGKAGGNRGFSIALTADGGYVAFGYTQAFGGGRSDFFLVKADSTDATQWSNTYGHDLDDEGHCVRQTADGGFVMVGTSRSFVGGTGSADILVIKVDAAGRLE